MRCLQSHAWPGNIRELENSIERAILLCDSDIIEPTDLPAEIMRDVPSDGDDARPLTLRERIRTATRRIERDAILQALRTTEGNVTRAARQLGLSRRGLQLKMKELSIEREA